MWTHSGLDGSVGHVLSGGPIGPRNSMEFIARAPRDFVLKSISFASRVGLKLTRVMVGCAVLDEWAVWGGRMLPVRVCAGADIALLMENISEKPQPFQATLVGVDMPTALKMRMVSDDGGGRVEEPSCPLGMGGGVTFLNNGWARCNVCGTRIRDPFGGSPGNAVAWHVAECAQRDAARAGAPRSGGADVLSDEQLALIADGKPHEYSAAINEDGSGTLRVGGLVHTIGRPPGPMTDEEIRRCVEGDDRAAFEDAGAPPRCHDCGQPCAGIEQHGQPHCGPCAEKHLLPTSPPAPRMVHYCEAAPPREVVEQTIVTLDGTENGKPVRVPLVWSYRMRLEWERHEAWTKRRRELMDAAYQRVDGDAMQRATGSRMDRERDPPAGVDAFGSTVAMSPSHGVRCALCGGWIRVSGVE